MLKSIIEEKNISNSSLEKISKKFKVGKNKISNILNHLKNSNIKEMIFELIPKTRKLKGNLNILKQIMDNQKIKDDSLKTILNKYNKKTRVKINSVQTIQNYFKKSLNTVTER